jgi:hypothetical protein
LIHEKRNTMQTVRAHFDGQQIQLEEPLELKPQDKLLVTLLRDNIASSADIELASAVDAANDDFLNEEEIVFYTSLK